MASGPRISYVICGSQRSGSNLLCEALWLAGAGRPDEYFIYWYMAARDPAGLQTDFARPWLVPPAEYLEKVLEKGTTPNGVFGVKIMWNYFDLVIDNLRALPGYRDLPPPEVLGRAFPNLRYVYISREDKARQAVSLAKAIQSRKWIAFGERVFDEKRDHLWDFDRITYYTAKEGGDGGLAYDFEQIALLHKQVVDQDEAWERYFEAAGTEPFRVVYEEFVRAYERTALDLLQFLGVAPGEAASFDKRAMKPQSDGVNDEWTRRFKEELAVRTS